MQKDDMRGQFGERIGRFGRVRRGVANAALFFSVGVLALGVGSAALLLLCGWTANPFINGILTLVAFGVLVWLLVRLVRRWEGRRTVLAEAFHAEALAGDLNSRVVSAVDFLAQSRFTPLTELVIEQARQDLDRPFEKMVDRTVRNRQFKRFVVLLAVFVGLGSTPWFSFARLGNTVALSAANLREILFPTRFELLPGTGKNIYRVGSKVEVGLRFTRFRYPEVTMLRETEGKEGVERTVMPVDASGKAALTLVPTLEQEYRIRFVFGNRTSPAMKLVFTSTPLIENMQTELVYPLYTRLVPKEMEGIQDRVTALSGTRVNLGFVFSKPLSSAVLKFDDGSQMPLDTVGRFASVSFVHSQERRATLVVEDIHGFALDRPHAIEFGLTADNPPRLIVPKHLKTDMPATLDEFAGFTFGARVEDDFGAAKCVVKWRQSTTEEPSRTKVQGEPIERVFIPPRPTAVAAFENIFREQAQTAAPGDLYTFQVEALDNRDPKPQSTVSAMFSIFIRGQGIESGTAGGGTDIMAKFTAAGGKAQKVYRTSNEGSRAVKMPSALTTAESYKSDFRAERNTDARGEVRGPMNKTAGDYGNAISGAK